MSEWPLVKVLLITYKRTDLACRTIQGVKQYVKYPSLSWHIADDGSPPEHIAALKQAIGEDVPTTNAERKGVGRSMNLGMRECLLHAEFILWLEDDWEICEEFNLEPCVQAMIERTHIGMARLGYLSPGLEAELISAAGHLFWRLKKGPTYTFTGHASLRHKRFCEAYGPYQEGLAPGETELYMCGTVNNKPGPDVVVPSWIGEWGVFGHIGGESLNNVKPE